jgi:hypothetical protein
MSEHLSDVRNIALIVRLVVTKDGRLVHGEFIDAHGQRWGQFRAWSELASALQDCAAGSSSEKPSPK